MSRNLGAACPPSAQSQAMARLGQPAPQSLVDRLINQAIGFLPLAGDLFAHIRSAEKLVPEVAQMETLVFEGTFTSATSITQPGNIKVPREFWFEMMGYSTYLEEPGLAVANLVAMSWNAQEVGKKAVFGSDQRFAQTQTINGSREPTLFPRSLYLFSPGADVKVALSWNSARTFNGGAKLAGVVIYGGLIARDTLRR